MFVCYQKRYVINVSSMEGKFYRWEYWLCTVVMLRLHRSKTSKHPHTNMVHHDEANLLFTCVLYLGESCVEHADTHLPRGICSEKCLSLQGECGLLIDRSSFAGLRQFGGHGLVSYLSLRRSHI